MNNELLNALEAHQKIGFPRLSDTDQMMLIYTGNLKTLNNLTPNYRMPYMLPEILKKYITITKGDFREFFINSGHIEKLQQEHENNPNRDGEWVEKSENETYYRVWQERGHISGKTFYQSYDSLINGFVDEYFRMIQ